MKRRMIVYRRENLRERDFEMKSGEIEEVSINLVSR